MSDLTFVQSDTAPSVYGTVTTVAPGDLSTVASARFQMRPSGTFRHTVDAPAVIVSSSALSLSLRYDWAAGDLDTPGDYIMRWQLTYSDTSVQHTEPENTITVEAA